MAHSRLCVCGGCDDDLETFFIKVQNKAIMESYADELFGLTRPGVLPEKEANGGLEARNAG